MSSREAGDYIEDIFNAMLDIREFTAEYSYDRFANDRKTQYAVIFRLLANGLHEKIEKNENERKREASRKGAKKGNSQKNP